MRNQPNPKQAFGNKKPRLSLTPLSAQIAQSEAQMDGALKYGEVNWRTDPVEAMTYVDAALRHLRLYENGENLARDTKVRNLGAVMACCAILIDAEAHGTLIDNRNHSPATCDMLHEAEKMVKHLKDMQDERDKKKPVPAPTLIGRNCKQPDFEYVPERIDAYHDMSQMPEDAFEVSSDKRSRCCNQTVLTRCADCPYRDAE